MHITYRTFIKKLIRNYVIGSLTAVFGVGGIFIFFALKVSAEEIVSLLSILFISLVVMLFAEFIVFSRHIRPIRSLFLESSPDFSMLQSVYFQTHRFPILAIKRIIGPHFLGLSIPAMLMLWGGIHSGLLNLPHYYILLAAFGLPLVACMHAFIEFFLTSQSIRPVAMHIRQLSMDLYNIDLSLNGEVLVSIQRKFQFSTFLIGTFPLFLFSLGEYIRQNVLHESHDYWKWTGIILLAGIIFSSLGAWVLSKEVQHPITSLYKGLDSVRSGDFDVRTADIYSDEFSMLVAGFNHMVSGLKERETMNNLLIQSYFSTLAAALDARDPYTAGHSERVAYYSLRIGRLARLPEAELDILHKTALLHDIGKIGVRDDVLLKDGKLTDEEFKQIKQHPVLGEKILKEIKPAESMAPLLPGVRSHHERYDGRGYPDGLTGVGIPLMGRIIAIADAFDAMTSDRPYRKGMPEEKALSILAGGKGTQWDPELTTLFIANYGEIKLREAEEGQAEEYAG
ncbi:HAMP domain-containing protein [Bacillus sp. OV322]|uniref:HD-GYP domain-containing protein n=1 Tax=Bacillus sp. OV322 TaxID=1882764 RepID=UPI0008EBBB19|nr:HD-GYP domain-containing protein [Bacillus sp. OV322]SFC91761.1 HAMP domain-containing protein [Bacillus sp. OV322]